MGTNELTTVVSFILFALLLFFFAITLTIRYRKRKKEHEQLKQKIVSERRKAQIEIQEQTLKHVGHEIHDNLGQVASLIKITLHTINTADEGVKEKVESAKELTRQLITDLKLLSVKLVNDRVITKGLLPAVQMEINRLNGTGLFEVSLSAHGDVPDIDRDRALILYRMIQEVLNNMVKHSGAKKIDIIFTTNSEIVIIDLCDDGKGFDTERKHEGAGLNNLRSRAELINAVLNMQSVPGKGTKTTIKILLK